MQAAETIKGAAAHLMHYRESPITAVNRDRRLNLYPWAMFTLGCDTRLLKVGLKLFEDHPDSERADGFRLLLDRIGDVTEFLVGDMPGTVCESLRQVLSQLKADFERRAAAEYCDLPTHKVLNTAIERLSFFADTAATSIATGKNWNNLGKILGQWLQDNFGGELAKDGIGFLPVIQAVRQMQNREQSLAPCLKKLSSLHDAELPTDEVGLRRMLIKGAMANFWTFGETDDRAVLELFGQAVWQFRNRIEDELLTARKKRKHPVGLKPRWNRATGDLMFGDEVIKRVATGKATKVVMVLDKFEKNNWQERIDYPGQQGTQEIHDTIKSLKHGLKVIRFRADGTGKGVVWELE